MRGASGPDHQRSAMDEIDVTPRSDDAPRCPFCHAAVGAAEPSWTCGSCDATHHQECVHEAGDGCAVCRAPARPRVRISAREPAASPPVHDGRTGRRAAWALAIQAGLLLLFTPLQGALDLGAWIAAVAFALAVPIVMSAARVLRDGPVPTVAFFVGNGLVFSVMLIVLAADAVSDRTAIPLALSAASWGLVFVLSRAARR